MIDLRPGLPETIPTDPQGRVDFARLLDQVVPGKLCPVESLVLGAPPDDFDELII